MVTGIQVSNEPVYNIDIKLSRRLVLFSCHFTLFLNFNTNVKLILTCACVCVTTKFYHEQWLMVKKKYVKYIYLCIFLNLHTILLFHETLHIDRQFILKVHKVTIKTLHLKVNFWEFFEALKQILL